MVDVQVPVYIHWGTCDQFHEHYRWPVFKPVAERVRDAQWINANCYPSEALITSAMNTSNGPSTSTNVPPPVQHPLTSASDSPSVQQPYMGPTCVVPPPIKGSSQKSRETWKESFARQSLAYQTIVVNESSAAKRSCEERVQHASTAKAQGRKGATVFYWEESNGFHIRIPVSCKNYVNTWSNYHGMQWHYDAFEDQWDLCSEFEPDAKSECSDDDSNNDPPMPSKKSHSSNTVTKTSPNIPSSSDMHMDSEPLSNDQQTPRDRAPPGDQPMPRDPLPESPTSPGSQLLPSSNAPPQPMSYPEAAPASGDWPVLCNPLPEPQTPLGGQQLLPINAPPMQHLEIAPSSGDDPMLCDPPPESQASLGGQQLPSINTPPMSHPEAAPSSGDQPMLCDPPRVPCFPGWSADTIHQRPPDAIGRSTFRALANTIQ